MGFTGRKNFEKFQRYALTHQDQLVNVAAIATGAANLTLTTPLGAAATVNCVAATSTDGFSRIVGTVRSSQNATLKVYQGLAQDGLYNEMISISITSGVTTGSGQRFNVPVLGDTVKIDLTNDGAVDLTGLAFEAFLSSMTPGSAEDLATSVAITSPLGGGLEATAIRVTVASDSTGVLSVDDNGSSLTVDNAALSLVGTGTEAGVLRVTLATDSTGLLSVDDNGASLTTDSAQLPAALGGGAEVGALLVTVANDSTGVLSVDDNGNSLTVDNATLSLVGTGTEAGVLRVTLATDSTGLLSVDDNGASLTTDSAQLPAALGGGVEAGALLVTVASDSTGVLSVDDNGSSLTIDNVTLSTTGGGTEAGVLRVTLANDGTGLVSVDDNGASLTVDNATLSLVGTGTEAGVLRVTVATDSTGVLSVDDNSSSLTVDSVQLPAALGGGVEAGALLVTIANNSTGVVSVDDNGASLTVDGTVGITETAWTTAGNGTYVASLVAKAAAGTLGNVSGYNSGPAQWIQIHNAAALPADAVVPLLSIKVSADANFSIDFGSKGIAMGTGITVCNSTTGPTKTIGAADCSILVGYT